MENHFNCIYCYTNKVNGKKYVGQAVDFLIRHKQHIYSAYNEKHIAYNYYFHRAIRRHGIENFEIEILIENLQNQEKLNYWECYYIVEFDTLANNKGYNLASGGSNGNNFAGKSDEELAEISRKHSETWKNKSDEELSEFSRKHIGEKNGRATLVDRFDKQGNYIDTKYQFEYVAMGFTAGNISKCCTGRRKSTGGYVFKYHNK